MSVSNLIDEAQQAERSPFVGGFNHVAQTTPDLDRLTAFYTDTLGVPFVELPDTRGRHGFLLLGDAGSDGLGPILHVFEAPEAVTGPLADPDAMFRRGRLDHIAIEARDESSLAELRDRLVASGACNGVVRVFGGHLLSLHVVDPDGMRLEICCPWTHTVFGDEDVVLAH